MPAAETVAPCSLRQRLIELLEERRASDPSPYTPSFTDRIEAIELEALVTNAPALTMVMIRVAREAVEFAERLATQPSPA